ncbi:Calcineurin-like phosphoesterase [Phytophthora cinnamomi]|uniref:Calcineurin-like phosphoesterase n=1 Tax=Phytophthora cinnamomi TaxID=4785 RepID=UPI00355AB1CE|nr:Calcineurin-like phosphoesterase [Phytophthora cinnamomi]
MAAENCSEALTYQFVDQLVDLEKPDFIAFTGDNVQVYGPSWQQVAIDLVTKAAEDRGIPYGMVFGTMTMQEIFREKIVEMLLELGEAGDTVFRMYFLDSGADALAKEYPFVFSQYDWIKQSQIDYYRQLSEAGRAERHSSSKTVLPAVMFFHIPLVEFVYSDDGCSGETYEGPKIKLCYGGGTGFGQSYGPPIFSANARDPNGRVDNKERHKIRSWKRHYDNVSLERSE